MNQQVREADPIILIYLLTDAVTQFQFITSEGPNGQNDKAAKRLARSHAVKQALQNKRKRQKASMQNFLVHTAKDEKNLKRHARVGKCAGPLVLPTFTRDASILDPFQTLPVSISRLKVLLNNCKPVPTYCRVVCTDTGLFRPGSTGPRASFQHL